LRRLLSSTVVRLVAAIFLVQLISGGAAIYLLRMQMLRVVHAERVRQVGEVRDDLLQEYYDGGRARLAEAIASRSGSAADPLVFVALRGDGPAASTNVAELPVVRADGQVHAVEIRHSPGGAQSEALAVAHILSDGSQLVVGASAAPDRSLDLAFAAALGLTVFVTSLLALAGALFLGYAISRRVHSIAQTAEALAAGNFAVRVPDEGSGDGFDHLRRQMNLMAERIGGLLGELQSVSSALAHDLRSPVARLRASVDTAMASAEPGASLEALQLARSDVEALETMLSTALELSRVESGAIPDRRRLLDLGEIAADLVELYEPLAEQSGVDLAVRAAPVRVNADRELLSRALANLIDNALKYGGSRIEVEVGESEGFALVRVMDNGAGIAPADRQRATERFARLDNARTRPGAGLGLTMVQAVARLHGGALELSSHGDGGGLVAAIRLPRL